MVYSKCIIETQNIPPTRINTNEIIYARITFVGFDPSSVGEAVLNIRNAKNNAIDPTNQNDTALLRIDRI
jgi:hypothetical protein